MSTVSGRIGCLETNRPLAGLIVSLHTTPKAGMTAADPAAIAADPFAFFSRSLGSTRTDKGGEFQIEMKLKSFLAGEGEQEAFRFMIAVLAPSTSSEKSPTGASRKARLLHWGELFHLPFGQPEACVIQVPIAKAKALSAPSFRETGERDLDREIEDLVRAAKEDERYRETRLEKLAPVREKKVKEAKAIRAKARSLVASLAATPKRARATSTWIREASEREGTQRVVMGEGLAAIAEASARAGGKIAVNMTADQLVSAGLPEPTRIREEGIVVDQEQMCRILNQRRGGPAMERVRALLEEARAEAAAEEPPSEPGGGEGEPRDASEEVAVALRQKILGQIKDMPSGEGGSTSAEVRPLTIDELNALLPSVKLGSGPSDTPAFHDFHNLQIAFPHIWTEAFDHELRSKVEELYESYAELHAEHGEGLPTVPEIQEIQDLKRFLQELGREDPYISASYASTSATRTCLMRLGYPLQALKYLHLQQKRQLQDLATDWWRADQEDPGGRQARSLLESIRSIMEHPQGIRTRLERLLYEVSRRINEPYAFHYFAPDTVNFGILTTYRQRWEPGPYQVGDLVSTIPLAPGERRAYTTKQVVKRSRAETELEKSMSSRRSELSNTRRAEAEIAERASMRTNFQLTSRGSFRFGIGEISAGSQLSSDQAQESSRVKKDFREAVLRAAQEYRRERSLEVRTLAESTYEGSTSGELSNPNNELTVTYLLYELERQYRISERIHRVTPVIMVAQDIPAPHEITESWLLAHEWILKRVILDDTLIPALDYLTDAFAGDEMSVSILKAGWETQTELVEKLMVTVDDLLRARRRFRSRLLASEEEHARLEAAEDAQGWLGEFFENLTVGDSGDAAAGMAEAAVKTLEKQLEYLEEELESRQGELALGKEALEAATKAYTDALKAQTNRRVAIDQLRMHIKENILYYMQAIWDHEPPDQRFFRLYHVEVELPESATRTCILRPATAADRRSGVPILQRSGERYVVERCEPPSLPGEGAPNRKKLVEIADLDSPLGYKGNYLLFPLKTCLYLTDFMMREFFDDYFGVRDPDLTANYSVEELLAYTQALIEDPDSRLSEADRDALSELVMDKLQQPRRDSDLVVVPTGELFMEALMGDHALLEKYKLNHRFYDMARARAEWRAEELSNLRLAARMLQEVPDYSDPEVDKHVVVEGAAHVDVETHE